MGEEKKNIIFGEIGNALKSAASDHVTAVSGDIYDEGLQMYQTDVNNIGRIYCLEIVTEEFEPSVEGNYLVTNAVGEIVKQIHYNGTDIEEKSLVSGLIYIVDGVCYSFDGISMKLLGQGGSGGNIINVTEMYPLNSGYYTLATARAAIKESQRGVGRCLSYESSAGKWETKQYLGATVDDWSNDDKWEDFGGGGTIKKLIVDSQEVLPDDDGVATVETKAVKQVTFNGDVKTPDEGGNIGINIDTITVDESLDENSTNPVENKAVTTKINEISDVAVGGVEVLEEDGKNTLNILNKQGNIIATTEFTGGGGGGGTSTASRIILTASLDRTQVKEGGNVTLTYNYDHVNADNESDGTRAKITITVKRGTTTTYESTTENVSKGTYTLDISDYLLVGTVDVYVKAECTSEDGSPQTKQVYRQVSVITLDLKSGYSIGTAMSQGGYADGDIIEIPYSITGSGEKTVSMYLDGSSVPTTQTVTKSGTTNGSFIIQASSLASGRHNVQLVAERSGLFSDSIYIDFLKGGGSGCFVGVKYYDTDGEIRTSDWATAKVKTKQYENVSFDIVAYDPNMSPASVKEYNNGTYVKDISVGRSPQTYTQRFTEKGTVYLSFELGTLTYKVDIDVQESKIDISETTQGLAMKLSAAGRSNDEQSPGTWVYGDIETAFVGFDWKSSGWIDNSLKLMNGAAITIDTKPFTSDIAKDGFTFEAEIRVSNIIDSEYVVLECMDNNKGFRITSESAGMFTGSSKKVTDEDEGIETEIPIGVETKFASNEWYKIAFMVGKRTEGRLMELFVNGERNRADIYAEGDNFNQTTPSKIYVRSEKADVEIRNIRMYNRAITDEEEFSNYAIDMDNAEAIAMLIDNNDVLDDETSKVSVDKIVDKGHGVMVVVRSGGLDPVNAENNKKTDFLCDYVMIYTPWGDRITIKNCNIRIQGTSSTKYARKNYRIYAAKGASPEVWINDVKQEKNVVPIMKDDPFPVKILCPKCDFSDSSMTHNTGTAKLYNEWMKELGLLTPPQKSDERVRSSIYGYPIDVFSAETIDGEKTYYGQYNMNNDKSDWYDLTGMTDKANHIALEFLNNTEKLCLFQCDSDASTQFESEFADALEFNYPKDTFWNGADTEGGEVNATETQKNAILRLWTWVRDCVPSGADMTFADVSTFASSKFKSEISQYFVLNHLLTWYLITDYLLMVDQRAKNMILRTWDLKVWYITYYDGDTMLGLRNDSFLSYLYNASRETWDAEKSKWAFEGHDSVLWALVLANLESEIKAAANSLRAVMTNKMVLDMFNEEQMGNWCEKLYNKSGKFKYIDPIIDGVTTNDGIKRYPEIYALQGSRKAHRTNFIKKRFSLLDGKYETGPYISDNIDMYMNRTASDAADTIRVVSNDLYYYGYGTNNATLQHSQKCEKDEMVSLTFTRAFTVNDPLRVYGASMMKALDFSMVSGHVTGGLNLNKCSVLQVLNFENSSNTPNRDWFIVLDQCRQLQALNLKNQSDAKTGTSTSTEINLSNQTKLQYLNAGGTNVNSVVLANGAPITVLQLPASIKTLSLEYLPKLKDSGLSVEGYDNVETFRFAQCPYLDWETILGRCENVKRIRVTGIDVKGDGELLDRYMSIGGVDADGNAVSTCSLVGTYRLTRFVDDDAQIERWKKHYPELNIVNAQYTIVMFDDAIDYPQNMTNLENGSSGELYAASGHLLKIRQELIPVTGSLNTVTGEWEGRRISNENYQYLKDGSSFDYTGSLGGLDDAMMRIPECYYKGINDFKNQRKYIVWSSLKTEPSPTYTNIKRVALSTLLKNEKMGVFTGDVSLGSTDVETIILSASEYNTYKIDVEGMKQVRFPGVNRMDLGGVFTDANGIVISTFNMTVTHNQFDFVIGDYIFTDVPDGAKYFVFTSHSTVDGNTEVIAVDSSEIEAIEPDWVHHEECLGGIYQTSVDSLGRLRSLSKATVKRGTGESVTSSEWKYDTEGNPILPLPTSTMNYTGMDFKNLAYVRGKGYQLFDYEMHKFMAILFFSLTGNRNSQLVCGMGNFVTTTGYTDALGNTSTDYISVSSGNKCLGFESFFGCVWEWMDNICVNVSSYLDAKKIHFPGEAPYAKDGVYHIFNPLTKTERKVQGVKQSGYCIARVKHGRYCDVIASALSNDNSSWLNNYCDVNYYSNSSCRFVGRSYISGIAHGGIVCANADNASSHSSTNFGSRLAFRGTIKITE